MPNPILKLIPKLYKNKWYIFINLEKTPHLKTHLSPLNPRWNKTENEWYLPYTYSSLNSIKKVFNNFAKIDTSLIVFETTPKNKEIEVPDTYLKTLLYRRFSTSTYKNYTSHFRRFINYYKNENLDKISKEQITDYLLHLIKTKNISTSTQNTVINSIKFYYEKVLGRETQLYWIDRPQREFKLPVVLSEEEVVRLLSFITNLKHLTIVSLLYSAGLRRGELLKIKKGDIDINRKQIKVVGGKGKKDRMTILSDYMGELLKKYVKEFTPTYWLFESVNNGTYSASSVAAIIKKATKKAGITKHVTPHALRHSFATHLMDQGIETRYIQTLLGHNSIETTSLYTHVSTKSIKNIKSPLDTILEKKPNDEKGIN
jgi:site-specific recombinase XerD